MEYEPRPSAKQVVDVLRILNTYAVSTIIERADYALGKPEVTDNQIEELMITYRQELRRAIGREYEEENATVTGVAYTSDSHDNPTGQEVFFRRQDLIYCGPTVQAIADVPRIVLEFYIEGDANDDEDDSLEMVYYLLPEDIRELEIIPAENLFDIVKYHAAQSRQRLSSDDFLQAPTSVQLDVLESARDIFNHDIQAYHGLLLELETERFMGRYDDMPMSFKDSSIDRLALEMTQAWLLIGTSTGCLFPETSDRPDRGFDSIDDFNLSHGAPCMVFRDDDNRATYVVPLDAITRIGVLENFDKT